MAGGRVGEGYIEIGADTSKVDKDLGRQMPKTGTRGGQVLATALGTALGIGAAKVVGSATRVINKGFTDGFKRLVAIDNAQKKLEGLGYSTKEVGIIMDNALSSVKGTAFGLGEAASIASIMVAAGVKPGEDLARTLTLMADTATIAGTSLNDMTGIFAQVRIGGKLTGKQLYELQTRSVDALGAIADHFGVTKEAAQAMVKEGKVSFDDFQAAMEKQLGGAAKKSGETVQGAFANIQAAIGRLGANLMEPTFKQLPKFLTDMTNQFDMLGPSAKSMGELVGKGMEKVFSVIVKATTAIVGIIAILQSGEIPESFAKAFNIPEGGNKLTDFILKARDLINNFKETVSNAFSNLPWLKPLVVGLASVAGVAGGLALVSSALGSIGLGGPALAAIGGIFTKLLTPVSALWGLLAAHPFVALGVAALSMLGIIGNVEGGVEKTTSAIEGFTDKIVSFADTLPAMMKGVEGQINSIVTGLMSAAQTIVPAIAKAITALIPVIITIITSLVPTLVSSLVSLLGTIVTAVVDILPVLMDAVLTLITAVVQLLPTLVPMLLEAALTLLDGLIQATVQILPMLIEATIQLVVALIDTLVASLPLLIEGAVTLLLGILEALTVVLPVLIEGIVTLVTALINAIPVLIPLLVDAAVQLLMGLVEAIPIVLPAVIEGIIALIMALINAIPVLIPALIEGALALLDGLIQAMPIILPAVIAALIQLLMAVIKMIPTLLGAIIQAAVQLFLGIVKAVPMVLNGLLGALGGLIASAGKSIASKAGEIGRNAKTAFLGVAAGAKATLSNTRSAAGELMTNAGNRISSALGTIKAAGMTVWNSLPAGLRSKIGDARASAGNVLNAIKGAFSGKGSIFSGFGGSMMSGLIGGIRGAAKRVASAAKSVVSGAIAAAKSALKINSPSKVFMAIGDDGIGGGLVKGIDAGAGGVMKSMNKVAKDLTKKFNNEFDGIVQANFSGNLLGDLSGPSAQRLAGSSLTPINPNGSRASTATLERPATVQNNYNFHEGSFSLDVSDLEELRTIEDFLEMLSVKFRRG